MMKKLTSFIVSLTLILLLPAYATNADDNKNIQFEKGHPALR